MSRCFFFQAEDGIRELVRSRGLGDVYKRQLQQRGRALDIGPDEGTGAVDAAVDMALGGEVQHLSLIHI